MQPHKKHSQQYKLIICDLDNTLFDWVDYFVASFYSMVEAALPILHCNREQLLDELKAVHQRHHDSEHPFALLETQLVKSRYPLASRDQLINTLGPAFHAFNSSRKRTLKAYPGIHETLSELRDTGAIILAHTESRLFAAVDRLKRLDLEQYFERIYCREGTSVSHPGGLTRTEWLRGFPSEKISELSHHQQKPDPSVLLEICANHKTHAANTLYIGDSMSRDMLMATAAGATAVWAKYGTKHAPGSYEKLVRITHWTEEDVRRELELRSKAQSIQPDIILSEHFSELLRYL